MTESQDYILTAELHGGLDAIIYEGRRGSDGAPVAVKVLRNQLPGPREIAKLKHEYALLKDLDLPGVVKVHALVRRDPGGLALVLERLQGRSLADVLRGGRLEPKTALEVGASLADTLAAVHQRQIIHKDVKPANVYIDPATRRVKLIDFGISTRLSQEPQRVQSPDSLEGTLAYVSPEQTGRMNRVVDHRTDLYSLGVTLYEMLTGAVPFRSADPMELVHSHIARSPVPPHRLAPDVPEVVSAIVMKLLAKAAEDRYQSAAGLKADLDACLAALQATGRVAPFPLGRRDAASELRLPQTLYGRDAELRALQDAWERASRGAASLVLVSGSAGVGKSALVHEIHKAIARRRGYFVAGKFDQLNRSVPYACVAEALRELVRQMLTEPAHELARWRVRLNEALAGNGQVLVDRIPELELVIGPQLPVPALGYAASQYRMNLVFQGFLRAVSAAERPLAVFLDDLQWADPASLKLLRHLLGDGAGASMLVIGAYRDNEVDASHPLALAVGELRAAGANVDEIQLGLLDPPTVTRFVADTLACEPSRAASLAALVFEKTHGNAFFVAQFLRALHDDGRLVFDARAGRWTWELERVAEMPCTDNVVDLMASKIQRLAPATLRAVVLAACIGHQFDLRTLATISERSPSEAAGDLWEALREAIVLPVDSEYRFVHTAMDDSADAPDGPGFNVAYRFLHDRVQQAAYSLIDADRKQALHLRIGRLLLAQRRGGELGEALFDVVHHLDLGAALITDPGEQVEVARLNLAAGRRAKTATAYEAAAAYFAAGAAILGAGAELERELEFELGVAQAECEYLAGAFDRAEALFAAILQRGGASSRRAEVHGLRMTLYTSQGRFADAVEAGLEGLALLGVDLRGTPAEQAALLAAEFAAVDSNLAERKIEALFDAPALVDPRQRALSKFLAGICASAYHANQTIFALAIVKQVNIALQHGQSDWSAVAFVEYGFVLAITFAKFAEAHAFGKLGIRLLERDGNAELAVEVYFVFALGLHYSEHVRRALEYFARAREAGLAVGHFVFLSYSCLHPATIRLSLGDELAAVKEDVEDGLALMRRTQDALTTGVLTIIRRTIDALTGRAAGLSTLGGDGFDEDAFPAAMERAGLTYVACFFYVVKLQLCYLAGEYARAWTMTELAAQRVTIAGGAYFTTELSFYACLTAAALLPGASGAEKERLTAALADHADKLANWAAHCPDNYEHKHMLVQAERARVAGDELAALRLYDQAIAAAEASGFVRSEALAAELCARFHRACGRPKVARAYLGDAMHGYVRWGATAKADQVRAEHADLLVTALSARPTGEDASPSTTTRAMSPQLFDAAAAVEAAQTLSAELVLDRVLERLMRLVTENAGAQRGALLLNRDGELTIEATVAVEPYEVRVGLARPLDAGAELAATVVQYVARTREAVVLDDAGESRFAGDPHVLARAPRSILCQALMHQGRLTGILYLENNAARRAFTPARLKLCGLISAQAAIAVENALLHERVQRVSDELRRTNEQLEEEVKARTAELRRAGERLEQEFAERARSDAARAALQEEVIRAQRARIEEMSTPLIPITDRVMVMPLVGTLDTPRVQQAREAAMHGAQVNRAEVVIVDITGVSLVDAEVATSLLETATALRLLGTRMVLTGIGAQVARTLALLDVDLGALVTRGTLQSGIAYAVGNLRASG
ncbi:Predicted ATPase [Nannocystis exedens]|uniref:Predicted ATPase n=1 Tax=Nannocystis exedens TaxID=54 RepID=A0A1I2F887_9BACT|nr:AAA family ATPase [Nannocystis exedens]PCC73002.1 Serine/threonine-protein kinase PknB [Nannocystis exedens]SFF01654.1 Predicted ATPase [Nannocystis exedens]